MSSILELPNAADIVEMITSGQMNESNNIMELSEAKLKEMEMARTVYIINCINYVFEYIKQITPKKIFKRVNENATSCYIYRFSPPAVRGYRTRYYSQVVYDTETKDCRFEYFRPIRHARSLWYFPIYYVMNGFTKNPKRTFEQLSVNSVEKLLTDYFTNKGYRIKFFRNRIINEHPTGNLVYVEWGPVNQTTTTTSTNTESLIHPTFPESSKVDILEYQYERENTNGASKIQWVKAVINH